MFCTGSEQQGQNIGVRTVFLSLTKILDLLVFFHQVCKKLNSNINQRPFKIEKNDAEHSKQTSNEEAKFNQILSNRFRRQSSDINERRNSVKQIEKNDAL